MVEVQCEIFTVKFLDQLMDYKIEGLFQKQNIVQMLTQTRIKCEIVLYMSRLNMKRIS